VEQPENKLNFFVANNGGTLNPLPFSDIKQYKGISHKIVALNPHQGAKTNFFFVHRYRAHFGGFFSYRTLDSRSGLSGRYTSGFSYFTAKGDCGWVHISKTRFSWPVASIMEKFCKRYAAALRPSCIGRFISGKFAPVAKKFTAPQYRNFSWHYRRHLKENLYQHYSRTYSLFGLRARATALDCLISGASKAHSGEHGILKIIPSAASGELTNYLFMRKGSAGYDPRYTAPDFPSAAFLLLRGPAMGPLVQNVFDSFARDGSNLRYGLKGFSLMTSGTLSSMKKISFVSRRGFFARGLSSRLQHLLVGHLKARAAANKKRGARGHINYN
jgi:hypothetical protein